ncbi:MAG: HAMP domain-containing histidine kinase [Myxococcales bacterium]|nr:HAMP domain-containing histidine kinase [Myxococcales bacterium]
MQTAETRAAVRLALVPVAPTIVVVVGLVAAAVILFVGLAQLGRTSDAAAALEARTLAATIAARLGRTPEHARGTVLEDAHEHTQAGLFLVDAAGRIRVARTSFGFEERELGVLRVRGEGIHSRPGAARHAFAWSSLSAPLEHLSLMVLVHAPSPATGTLAMTKGVLALTLSMLGLAAVVAVVFMRATRDDVTFVEQRIRAMARERPDGAGVGERATAVPLRSFDQVGVLTAALNALVGRFAEAERGYRQNLEAAARIDRERSEFLAGLSHELRTPLNAILGFSHLLETEADGPLGDDARESLGEIRKSGEHLKSLVDDILDLSAAETGQLRLTRAIVDVTSLADEVVREARATVGSRPIALVMDGEARSLAWADVRRLRQVLTNLVFNALKATAEGTVRLSVRRERERGMIAVDVADTGRGIPADVLEAIFEPYRQAGEHATRTGGVGLGLAIARRLVLLHDGELAATSTVGRGSVFTMRVPDERARAKVPQDSLLEWSEAARGTEPARGVMPSLEPDRDSVSAPPDSVSPRKHGVS